MRGEKGQKPLTNVGAGPARTLRIYIPREVIDALKLEAGDAIQWTVAQEDGRQVAKFRKVRLVVADE